MATKNGQLNDFYGLQRFVAGMAITCPEIDAAGQEGILALCLSSEGMARRKTQSIMVSRLASEPRGRLPARHMR